MSKIEDTVLQAKDPLSALVAISESEDTPEAISDTIQNGALKIMLIDLHKQIELGKRGPVTPRAKMQGIEEVFEGALKWARENNKEVDKAISMTVKDVGIQIAEVLDKGLRRILLQDEFVVTEAHLDLLSCHAEMVSILEGISLNEEQTIWARDNYVEDGDSA